LKNIMIQGTSSDAGKSYVTTALCRALANRGISVAPFKSQNMSNNSYVAEDGCEISRAQGVQAEAAKVQASVYMNPILLKPTRDTHSEVVLFGKVFKGYTGMDYRKDFAMTYGVEAIEKALQILHGQYKCLVIEGAGSPAEVNLNDREIVNMRVAELADASVILVTDVDRGGSFASVVGTLELLKEHRHRFKGVIFNKFRGDVRLLQDGLDWLEKQYDIKVVGVLPMIEDIYIETEDAQSRHLLYQYEVENPLDIGVIHLERVSNNTDVEPFIHEKDVSIRIIKNANHFGNPHAIIIPGTKSTMDDLSTLYDNGLANKLIEYYKKGGFIAGICGGYQMLGTSIEDPCFMDQKGNEFMEGLGILPVKTVFTIDKSVRQNSGITNAYDKSVAVEGYEIHLGQSQREGSSPFMVDSQGVEEGCLSENSRVFGTYLHHIFHNDAYRNQWLNKIRINDGREALPLVDTAEIKEYSYEKLAEYAEKYLDMDYIMQLIQGEGQ